MWVINHSLIPIHLLPLLRLLLHLPTLLVAVCVQLVLPTSFIHLPISALTHLLLLGYVLGFDSVVLDWLLPPSLVTFTPLHLRHPPLPRLYHLPHRHSALIYHALLLVSMRHASMH